SRPTCSAADFAGSVESGQPGLESVLVYGIPGTSRREPSPDEGLGSVLMNIHEYQAKALLSEFGVPVSKGVPVLRPEDAETAAKARPGPIWVEKSQIHAGGGGKGKLKEASAGDKGGVRIAKSVGEVKEFARQMLGATLVTVQTGPAGKEVNRLYVEDGSDID